MADRQISTYFLIFLFFPLFCFPLSGREVPLPTEEAPTALFEAELQDSEVDFFIQGSWRAELSGGFGFVWGSAVDGLQPAVLPDFTDGYYFQQTPALDLSLWYRDRYFFETSLTEEQTLETFLFGYYGEEGDVLQELRFGNTDIGYGDIGPFGVPAVSSKSLGAYTRLNTESTEHHIALRYDPARSEEMHFRGKNLIEEETFPVEGYIRGRFFILPDGDVSGLEVYLQDDEGSYSDGEGRSYRRLDSDEMTASAAEGLLYLKSPAAADLLVHYTSGGFTVGDVELGTGALCGVSGTGDAARLDLSAPAADFNFGSTNQGYIDLGLDFSAFSRTIGGKTTLLLYSPGQWSPFELQGAYSAASLPGGVSGSTGAGSLGGRTKLYLSPRGSGGGVLLPMVSFQGASIFRISPEDGSIRELAARYPLLSSISVFPDAAEFYGSGAASTSFEPDRELRLEKLTPVTGYNLGPEALEGSIEVLRNGVPTGNYTFNPDTGEIVFFLPPAAGERIDITYRSATARAVGGDLYAASVNTFRFSDAMSADLNLGLRWNADSDTYITEAGEAEGSVLAVGGLDYQSEKLSFRLEGGVNLSSPNTTGRLRLFGMDDSAYPVVPGPENLYPGAPFSTNEYESGSDAAALDLLHANRGKLSFRDYYAYSFAGGYSLQYYGASLPADKIYPYDETGGENRTGPYPVATGSETDGDAMVLEYELAASEWVSGRIPLAHGNGEIDLSSLRAISLLVKHTGRPEAEPSGDIDLHIAVGRLAEDLDYDGILDEEDSPYDGGFSFNPDTGPVLPVAPALVWSPGDSKVNTEDLDGNGVLEGSHGASAALPGPMVESGYHLGDIAPTIPSGSWRRIIIPLSSEDRAKLSAATALDIVLVESTDSTGAEGRLLVADIDFQGTPFSVSPTTDLTTLDIHTRALDPGSPDYESLMSDAEAELLNGDSVFDTKVLRIAWDTADGWDAEGFLNPVDLGEYGALSFFMKTGAAPPDSLTLLLQNPDGEGLAVEFSPPAHTDWRRYTWHLEAAADQGRVSAGAGELSADDVSSAEGLTRNGSARGVNRLIIAGNASGAGEIELDEFYLHEPVTGIGLGGRTEFTYRHPEAIFSLAGRGVLQDIFFRQVVYGRQDSYGGGLSAAPAENFAHSNDLGFSLLDARADIQYSGNYADGRYLPSGGYRILVPLLNNHIRLQDRYFEDHQVDSIEAGRESSLLIQAPEKASLRLAGDIDWNGDTLDRTWRVSAGTDPGKKTVLSLTGLFGTQSDESDPTKADIYGRYGRFTSLLLPFETRGDLYRISSHQMDLQYRGNLFSMTLSPGIVSITHPGEEPFSLTTAGSWDFTMRADPPEGKKKLGNISLNYARSAGIRDDFSTEEGFFRDLEELFQRIPDYPLLLTSLPLTELWEEELREDFIRTSEDRISASYSAKTSLVYQNQPGSQLFNLLIPTRLSAGAVRSLSRDYDSLTDTLGLSGSYRTTAVNLFGKLGRYPFFQWYRTEEIGHSLGYEGTVPLYGGGEDETHRIDIGQNLELTISERSSIGMENELKLKLSEGEQDYSSLLFLERQRPVNWDIPFRERLEADRQYLHHREELDFEGSEGSSAEEIKVSIIFSHTSELRVPETGFFKVFGRVGYEQVKSISSGETLTRNNLAVELGAELELQF